MKDISAPNEAFPTRTLLWICFVISLVLTAHWAIGLYSNVVLADSISHAIKALASAISITDSTLASSLEIERLAVKLNIVNAASSILILKLSILWTTLVSSLVIYPVLASKLAKDSPRGTQPQK
jgi:hypothetical protein